jgi:ATP adenylyltransferase
MLKFEIRLCPALQAKPKSDPDITKLGQKPDPFAPPYNPNLYVGELRDEDGDEYVVLVRYFFSVDFLVANC